MNDHYRTFFGFAKEPFATDIGHTEILKTPELEDVNVRFEYVTRLGAVGIITGEVGSGKSTAVRYALNALHPAEYRFLVYHRLHRLHNGILPTAQGCTGYLSVQQLQGRYGQNH